MAKRPHGEGTVYQRSSDGRWVYAFYDPATGQRRTRMAKTKRDIYAIKRNVLRALEDGFPVALERQRLGQFLDDWLEGRRPPAGKLAPRTYERYEGLVRLHIKPPLGQVRLRQLTPKHLWGLYKAKQEEGLTRTVRQIHNLLHAALQKAVREGRLARNICDAIEAPKDSHQEVQALTPDQARKLLEVSQGDPHEALYTLALLTGMRRGELLGLKWTDVRLEAERSEHGDLLPARIEVRRTLQRVRRQKIEDGEAKTEWIESPPKSKSRRSIVLIPQAVAVLRQHRKRQLEAHLLLGPEWADNDLVFPNAVGRPLEAGNVRRRSFRPLLEKAGLPPIRFHDLRHSAASLLLSLGVHPKIVQEILGHSSFHLTMDTYSHVMPTLQGEALERLGALLVGESAIPIAD